jgi:hypothetical protein
MVVCDQPPEKGQSLIQDVQWTGHLKRKHFPEYLRFCHVVNSHLANLWQLSVTPAFQITPTLWELWQYAPSQAPEKPGSTDTDQEGYV